ncbi:MAG: hypothetical protein WD555_05945 [Fulvivirga sp.]
MKSTLNILFLLSFGFLALLTLSCEENEPEISGIEPYFNVKFINQDSLEQLDQRITIINALIKDVNDSLKRIEAEIAGDGDEIDYTALMDTLNFKKDSLNTHKTFFNTVIATIKSGRVQITSLTADGGAGEIIYQDSLNDYRFPLNTHADSSLFFITIADETDTLKATYSRHTIVKERAVYIEAINFNITDDTFNDLKIRQSDSTNFSSDEATVTVYF